MNSLQTASKPLSADDTCPRCGGGFHCGVADATPCPCSTLTLSAATQARLREAYSGCLCLACLREIAAQDAAQDAARSAAARP